MLKWYYYVLFAIVTVVALSMTWWSLFDLGVQTLGLPVLLSAVLSLLLDIGGLVLLLLSIEYAKTQDSGFWTELWTYLFIATSTYIVVQHGIINNYVTAGVVMFASAPIVLAVVFKAILSYLTRQHRRESGRVVEKLPSIGWLTWLRYGPQAWGLMSVAMRQRIINAAQKLDIAEDKHRIFKDKSIPLVHVHVEQPETAVQTSEITSRPVVPDSQKMSQQLPEAVRRQELTSSDKVSLPVWLPHEPTMSLATLVRTCLDNGVVDLETMFRYAKDIKGQEVNKMSLAKTLSRQKAKEV